MHWGCRDLGDIVGIGETATLKLAQVSSEVTEVSSIGWLGNVIYYDCKSFFPNISHYSSSKDRALALYPTFHLLLPPAARKIIEILRWGSEIWELEKHGEPIDGSLQESSSGGVELEIL